MCQATTSPKVLLSHLRHILSELVILKFNRFSETVDIGVHVVHITKFHVMGFLTT